MGKEIFEKALNAYKEVHCLVNAMGEFAKKKGCSVKPDVLNRQLDVLLQYSFLEIALFDRSLDKNEIAFIKGIAKFGDLCEFLQQKDVDITWEKIAAIQPSTATEFVESLREPMISLAENIEKLFAAIDASTPDHDYLKDFVDNVVSMYEAFIVADGNALEVELNNVNNTLMNHVCNTIIGYRNAILENKNAPKESNEGAPCKKTLKDFYGKKN